MKVKIIRLATIRQQGSSGSDLELIIFTSDVFSLPSAFKIRFYAVTKAFYRRYDVTLLPVMCLDMHARHLMAILMDAGYKRRKFLPWHQLSLDG